MKFFKVVSDIRMNVALNDEPLKVVECFEYLGSKISIDGEIKTEVKSWINDVGKCLGNEAAVMGINVKRRLYEGVVILTALCG